ncbi:MAG: secretin and TonB N-terminal domain-containing protein [Muribaculum sp.]|nr:secretin and TonB N-terminal domain-containing protein [Muribaculum sp.]
MRHFLVLILACISFAGLAQNVSISAKNSQASAVFRSLMQQTGKNFVYSSELLQGMRVTVEAKDKPLKRVLDDIFADTDIEYKIKGKNVVLKRKKKKEQNARTIPKLPESKIQTKSTIDTPVMLQELEVVSRLESPQVETAEIGARKVTGDQVRNTPVLFGEADVIKALTMEPGVNEGTEGMAGMNVHGGNTDENLYMLDNVPLYQVNHFAGLFSAFNTDIIRYIDFFKTSMPAKYDGRLSSFLDVRTLNGTPDGHRGSARLGLTSGAFNIRGPIGKKTSYLVGLRRSWYDVLTIPALAVINSQQDETSIFHYYFMDLNAKLSHKFSDKATGFVSVYFGDDRLKVGYEEDWSFYTHNINGEEIFIEDGYDTETNSMHWGNLVAQLGLNYRFRPNLTAEFTAAYTRYFSDLTHHYKEDYKDENGIVISQLEEKTKTNNNINDWIFRGDFDWQPNEEQRVRFGANFVRHSFLPQRLTRSGVEGGLKWQIRDSTWSYGANEANIYIEDDWKVSDKFRLNAGIHASLFNIDHGIKHGVSPRLSAAYHPSESFAFKAAYSRTTQYVHQLSESYLALPTDQWIPVMGKFKPQTADKVAAGAYWQSKSGDYAVSVEGYWKWMRNLVDYCEEYYLKPPVEMWNARLTSGSGTAKGIDVKLEKKTGKVTGHIAYSLGWADRTFAEKNGGKTYPARFDNRHTINILVNWNISKKVQLNAAWTGHSGNRFTFLTQSWEQPYFGYDKYEDDFPLKMPLNYYQLPFYHRLDLACTVRNKRGYWTFSLYNAYNHLNTIAITRGENSTWEDIAGPEGELGGTWISRPVFKKVAFLPIIPSISYTWEF